MVRVLVVLTLVVVLAWGVAERRSRTSAVTHETHQGGDVARARATASGSPRITEPQRRSILQRITVSRTYLSAFLGEADSILRRWPERIDPPLRVYFEPTTVAGHAPDVDRAVREAFRRWERVMVPVTFRFVDSASASDVRVHWVRSFDMARAGQAEITWRGDGWIQRGTLTLATHSFTGRPLDRDAIFTVALHEIGHLLGLGHSDDDRDVMYPTTSVHDLTSRDRQTAMLLYSLPPGSLKATAHSADR